MFALGTTVFAVICAPPVAADVLNQPANVNPALVGFAGNVPIVVPACLVIGEVAGVPPLPLNVSVTFALGSVTERATLCPDVPAAFTALTVKL